MVCAIRAQLTLHPRSWIHPGRRGRLLGSLLQVESHICLTSLAGSLTRTVCRVKMKGRQVSDLEPLLQPWADQGAILLPSPCQLQCACQCKDQGCGGPAAGTIWFQAGLFPVFSFSGGDLQEPLTALVSPYTGLHRAGPRPRFHCPKSSEEHITFPCLQA